ncbi:MAG: ribulose-phosphate 3-epimerase [Peptococcaceae bacterium]|jgi:ribulose-phosphate 3-epimerase|nr:ribulose-phosphate 3-epimerase [Peptococcaceae bacterium]
MKTIIAPSLLAADASRWGGEIQEVLAAGGSCLHLDIMDGRFVPNLTFGPGPVGMLRGCGELEFDAHLMTVEPERLLPAFAAAGVDSATVHSEACPHLHYVLEMIRDLGMRRGVAVNPATPVWSLEPVLPLLDRVLIMTVNPGFGGQKAILAALEKVVWLRRRKERDGLTCQIQVDGGVNRANIKEFLAAGAENIVIGSALFQLGRTGENLRFFQAAAAEYEREKVGGEAAKASDGGG